jgi:F0F1-type ATP synthase epsilon subunit
MINLKIASPNDTIFNGEVNKVTVKTIDGVMTLLPRHIPIISVIENGYVVIDDGDKIDILKGFITVDDSSNVSILVSHI